MDDKTYITWVAKVDAFLDSRAKERQEERQARHEAQQQTAKVIDKLRMEVMDIDDDLQATKGDVKTLEQIAASTEALLKGVMGRSGMVSEVNDHSDRLDKLEHLIQEVVSISRSNGESIQSQNKEIKWMQRALYVGMGLLMAIQFAGVDGVKQMIFGQ